MAIVLSAFHIRRSSVTLRNIKSLFLPFILWQFLNDLDCVDISRIFIASCEREVCYLLLSFARQCRHLHMRLHVALSEFSQTGKTLLGRKKKKNVYVFPAFMKHFRILILCGNFEGFSYSSIFYRYVPFLLKF